MLRGFFVLAPTERTIQNTCFGITQVDYVIPKHVLQIRVQKKVQPTAIPFFNLMQ